MEVTGELGLREWPPVAKATEKPKNVGAPKWLDDEDTGARLMDPNTAQVVPRELCEKLFERSGATLVVGAARGLETAAGGGARDGRVPLEGVYSSSVVFAGDDAVKAEPVALFCAEDSNSCHLEVYPRVDGSVYMCGIGGSDYVRGDRLREGGDLQDATKMRANPDRVAAAVASFSGLAPFARGKDPS
ncbi:FAD dependent oxidoreductase [Aureococcus anophagefferens]|nr:FAD dependent oxidoreductase [Aureococcus anophagefferens]